jgi:hypothetical protein
MKSALHVRFQLPALFRKIPWSELDAAPPNRQGLCVICGGLSIVRILGPELFVFCRKCGTILSSAYRLGGTNPWNVFKKNKIF